MLNFKPFHKCCSNVCLHSANGAHHLRNSAKVAALLPIKTPFLEGFCPFFVLFLAFSRTICIWNAFFAKKKSFHLTFSSRRSAGYKVPPRIGGHHFLLCQQTNTKDIAGQSARGKGDKKVNPFPQNRSFHDIFPKHNHLPSKLKSYVLILWNSFSLCNVDISCHGVILWWMHWTSMKSN